MARSPDERSTATGFAYGGQLLQQPFNDFWLLRVDILGLTEIVGQIEELALRGPVRGATRLGWEKPPEPSAVINFQLPDRMVLAPPPERTTNASRIGSSSRRDLQRTVEKSKLSGPASAGSSTSTIEANVAKPAFPI